MDNQTEKKWYQKPTAVVILLIFFFPVGLYLMWKHEVWSKTARWVITGLIVVGIVLNVNQDSINPCDCIELESRKRIGAQYDYDKYNSCKSAFGTYRMMEIECMNSMGN